ncbi:hypothetical protein E2562_017422 [Oryza meyeriana var. granulata]|uniref:Uncharacterized protein n=1 Tax=Oryza meyeriana var. granulata TaxID=110450 RepID=A0A6G1D547_9ORYZ|nr:hypothetical protein E2562_017422 [Oryza meyeriana var. granulata]
MSRGLQWSPRSSSLASPPPRSPPSRPLSPPPPSSIRPRSGKAPPITGDRYLDLSVRFVGRHKGALLDGSVTLRLRPVGLHYVASRLEALRELEAVRAGAPVDYLRAYVADFGDHHAIPGHRVIVVKPHRPPS